MVGLVSESWKGGREEEEEEGKVRLVTRENDRLERGRYADKGFKREEMRGNRKDGSKK